MARGAAKEAKQQLQTTNAAAGQNNQNAQQLFGMETPAIQSMINNPGPNASQQAAIIGQSVGAANAPFASAADQASRTAGRTRNAAGLDVSLDSMARGKSAADADATQKAQLGILENQQQQRQQGIQDASGLFGTSEGTMASLYGQGANDINAQVNAQAQQMAPPNSLIGAAGNIPFAFAGK